MNAHIVELLYRHFSGFGYGIVQWDKLSDTAKQGWRSDAVQIFSEIAKSEAPAVEIFYRKYSGKGNPPCHFKDANDALQNKWRGYVEKFLMDLIDEAMPLPGREQTGTGQPATLGD